MQPEEKITKLNIDLLIPNPNQPRKKFNEESIKELSISIKEYGILNPILVRKKENLYEIIAGERRYRAAKLADLKEVPVIIKEIDDSKLTAIALTENIQRENISPIDEAKSYQDILNKTKLKEQELSNIIGKSQSYISNKLRLLKLPKNIQEALIDKKISERHARSLINIKDEQKQTALLNRVIKEKLTVKELDEIINEKEITDEEIKNAIDDIMKALNINSEIINEKEEKDSENMNNGNFIPNNNEPNNNINLNTMNNQTLGNAIPQQPIVEPAPESMAQITPNFGNYNQENLVPQPPEPSVSQTPNLNFNSQPIPEPTSIQGGPLEQPQVMPNIIPEPTLPEMNNNFVNQNTVANPTNFDTPLFDQSIQIPPVNNPTPELAPIAPTPTYEVPVGVNETLIAPSTTNNLTEVESFLNTKGIKYKKYSNETNQCIIIEL